MIAERNNEKAQSRNASLFIAAAKARVWASEGWEVVVTDDTGKKFTAAELEVLCSPDGKKSRPAPMQADGPNGGSDASVRETVKHPQTGSTAARIDTWESLESAVARTG